MAAKTRKQTKACFIVCRYFVKRNQNVCCVVRNGESKEYNVTIQPDGRVTCLSVETGERCKGNNSKHQCYHVKHVLQCEQERVQAPKPATPAYDVVAEAEKVAANAEAELDAAMYEVLATTKKVSVPPTEYDSCKQCGCRIAVGAGYCKRC